MDCRGVALLVAIAFTAPCRAQQDAPQPYRLRVDAQLVLIDASVTDRRTGTVIHGLQPADFVLSEDGAPQNIMYLSQDTLPLSVSLLFDLTDTVSPVLEQLARGAKVLLTHLRDTDSVAILTFSDHTELIQRYTTDHSRLIAALSEAAAGYDRDTPTYLHEDLFTAIDLTSQVRDPQSRRVQIWFTDGTANEQNPALFHREPGYTAVTPHTRAEATDHLLRSGTVVSLLLARSRLTTEEAAQHPGIFADFNRYADLTGGPVVEASTKDAVLQLANMLDALRQRYTLGYRPSAQKSAGTVHHITLVLSPAFFAAHPFVGPKDFVVRTREAYVR